MIWMGCNYNGNLPSWFNSKKYTAQDYLWEETKKDPYYNCYSFALKRTDKSCCPGEFCGKKLSSLEVSKVKDLVISDLKKRGHSAYVIDKSVVADFRKTHTVIALRTGSSDFHFMRYIKDGYWGHKPGDSAKLVHKYEPWNLNIWQTKAYKNGGWQSNYLSYSSSTVLIAYC